MQLTQLPTLLIISDQLPVLYWLKKHLGEQFYIIDAAKKGKAIEVVRNTHLDFIILDSYLEDEDPLELTRQLRKLNLITPILLITGRLKKTYRETALDAGVTDFLFEELDEEELETRIATGLKAAEIRQKVSALSDKISILKSESNIDYFKNKLLLQNQTLQLLSTAKEKNLPVSILIVRIDKYLEIQTRFGTLLFEEILLPFSELLTGKITEREVSIPLGNGQYALLLCKPLTEAKTVAADIRSTIQKHRFETKHGPFHITATFAIADLETTEQSFHEMIDSALKTLKQSENLSNIILPIEKRN